MIKTIFWLYIASFAIAVVGILVEEYFVLLNIPVFILLVIAEKRARPFMFS